MVIMDPSFKFIEDSLYLRLHGLHELIVVIESMHQALTAKSCQLVSQSRRSIENRIHTLDT